MLSDPEYEPNLQSKIDRGVKRLRTLSQSIRKEENQYRRMIHRPALSSLPDPTDEPQDLQKVATYYRKKVTEAETRSETLKQSYAEAENRLHKLHTEYDELGGEEPHHDTTLNEQASQKQKELERLERRRKASSSLGRRKVSDLEKEVAVLNTQQKSLKASVDVKDREIKRANDISVLRGSLSFRTPSKLQIVRASKVDSRAPRFLSDIRRFSKVTLPSLSKV